MIDWNRVAELQEDLGEDDFTPVLELFLDEVETTLMRLGPEDAAGFADDLHGLKGAAANLGFAAFADLCRGAPSIDALADSYRLSKRALMRGLALGGGRARAG